MGYLYTINRSIMIQKPIVIAQKGSKIIFATEPLSKTISVTEILKLYFRHSLIQRFIHGPQSHFCKFVLLSEAKRTSCSRSETRATLLEKLCPHFPSSVL